MLLWAYKHKGRFYKQNNYCDFCDSTSDNLYEEKIFIAWPPSMFPNMLDQKNYLRNLLKKHRLRGPIPEALNPGPGQWEDAGQLGKTSCKALAWRLWKNGFSFSNSEACAPWTSLPCISYQKTYMIPFCHKAITFLNIESLFQSMIVGGSKMQNW